MTKFWCWFCCLNFSVSSDLKAQFLVKKIHNIAFNFVNCPKCQRRIYRWKVADRIYHGPKIHVVLYEPEIVGNVGTIIRLAANFDFALHLIEPFGFIYDLKRLTRSSVKQNQLVKPRVYPDWANFLANNKLATLVFTSAQAQQTLPNLQFNQITTPLYLVFGRESVGLPTNLLQKSLHSCRITTTQHAPSINLANSVSLVVHHVLLQFDMLNLF